MIFKVVFVPVLANAGYLVNKKSQKLGAKDFLAYKSLFPDLYLAGFQSEIPELKTSPMIEMNLEEVVAIPAFDHQEVVTVTVSNPKEIEWVRLGYKKVPNPNVEESETFLGKTLQNRPKDFIEIRWELQVETIKKYWKDNGYKTNI